MLSEEAALSSDAGLLAGSEVPAEPVPPVCAELLLSDDAELLLLATNVEAVLPVSGAELSSMVNGGGATVVITWAVAWLVLCVACWTACCTGEDGLETSIDTTAAASLIVPVLPVLAIV